MAILQNEVFTTEDLISISGFSRGKLDDLRSKGILHSLVSNLPKYTYFELLKLVLYLELKPYRKLKEVNTILITISAYAETKNRSDNKNISLKEKMLSTDYLLIGEVGEANYLMFRELEEDLIIRSNAREILNFIGEIKQTVSDTSNIFPNQEITLKNGIVINMSMLRNKADTLGKEQLNNFEYRKNKSLELLAA